MIQDVKRESLVIQPKEQLPLDLKKQSRSNFHTFVQLNKENAMYAICTSISLGAIIYGLTNGFVTGDFTQAKFGVGLFGMSNLIVGNLSNDDEVAKTSIKLGSIASIIFFLSSGDSIRILPPKILYS